MKKLITLLPILTLALVLASPVYAQPTTTPPIRRGDDRSEFRTKLDSIRDEKKKTKVENLDQRISQINASRTSIMLGHLTKIEEVLNKIEARALEVEKRGKDISAVKAAIVSARTAIAQARSAVTAQAAKTYTIDITTEDKLGPAVSTTRIALAKDFQTAHQTVVTARKSVRDVLTALSKIVGEKLPESTEK